MPTNSSNHNLDNVRFKLLTAALLKAFPDLDSFQIMLQLELDVNLVQISRPANLQVTIFNVITWAKANNRIDDLVLGALAQNPHNSALRSFADNWGVSDAAQFERIVRRSVPLTDVEEWRARMIASERSVCRIEAPIDTGCGTGFLISPDIVITNFHVIAGILQSNLTPQDIVLRFDFKVNHEGRIIQNGKTYTLAQEGWKIDESPVEELDFVLLRTRESPGTDPASDEAGAPRRGWIAPQSCDIQPGDPIFIIQHPSASPMKFAPGKVLEVNPDHMRLNYDANTEAGSSGSPCFRSDWGVVALHHFGGNDHNRGVSFPAILGKIRRNGHAIGLD